MQNTEDETKGLLEFDWYYFANTIESSESSLSFSHSFVGRECFLDDVFDLTCPLGAHDTFSEAG